MKSAALHPRVAVTSAHSDEPPGSVRSEFAVFSLLINTTVPSTAFQQTNDCMHTDTTSYYSNHSSYALLSILFCHAS